MKLSSNVNYSLGAVTKLDTHQECKTFLLSPVTMVTKGNRAIKHLIGHNTTRQLMQ